MKGLRNFNRADVTWLAKEWERLAAQIDYPTRAFTLEVLYILTYAYLRGKNMRMGSPQGFEKYCVIAAQLQLEVMRRVIEDEAKVIWFPALVRLGFVDTESAVGLMKSVATNKQGLT